LFAFRYDDQVPAVAPLFYLRGLQVIEQPKGSAAAGHVALQDWCGFPKAYDQYNEWLILNYMVRITVCFVRYRCAARLPRHFEL